MTGRLIWFEGDEPPATSTLRVPPLATSLAGTTAMMSVLLTT